MRLTVATTTLALLVTPAPGGAAAPEIPTASGRVAGVEADGVRVFKGIPYAASTAGANRWRPPAPVAPWTGVRQATAFAPDCPAPPNPPGAPSSQPRTESEDCLYLNVWTPAGSARGLPVMVWIFGSGFRIGTPTRPTFDGAALARQGVVLVSIGFRTGPLGYLALPKLSAESPRRVSGNYGILDAIAALRWVQANIAAFGGDPGRVTIFGQSSGSETVNILTASPLARGLFQRAIQESGGSFGLREAKPLATLEGASQAFVARAFGTDDPAALRRLPAATLLAPSASAPHLEPVVDGWLLPQDVHAIYAAGRQNRVPMIVGSNADEAQLNPRLALAGYRAKYADQLGAGADALLARFPATDDAGARAADKRLGTLLLGDFNAATSVRLAVAAGSGPVYRYRFEHAPPAMDGAPPTAPRGAYHGAEIAYAFGNLDREPRAWTATDRALEATLSRYWINFARTGDPNGAGLPRWQSASEAPGMLLRIGDTPAMAPAPAGDDVAVVDRDFYGPGGIYAEAAAAPAR